MADKDAEIKALKERIKELEAEIKNLQNTSANSAEIKVIKERVKNHKEISDRTFHSNRNFGIFIILALTFIGAPSIYYSIGALVKHSTKL